MPKNAAAQVPAPHKRQMVPLNKIEIMFNVRDKFEQYSVDELAQSILQVGLINPLTVLPGEGRCKEKYYANTGGLRWRALMKLAKAKKIPADWPVPVTVLPASCPEDAVAAERMSLEENVRRYQMDPVNEARAFAKEVNERKLSIEQVAAMFGRDVKFVKQRVKLASVNPKLIEAYYASKMTLDALQAFTVSNDHKRQWAVWKGIPKHYLERMGNFNVGSMIRNALLEKTIPGSDRRVRFVGLENYLAAGGRFEENLFTKANISDPDAVFLTDAALLDKLVAEKMQAAVEKVKAEGWKTVTPTLGEPYSAHSGLVKVEPIKESLPKGLAAKRKALEKKCRTVAEEETEEADEKLEALQTELEAIEAQTIEEYEDEVKQAGLAVVAMDHNGGLVIERGWITPARATASGAVKSDPAKPKPAGDAGSGFSRSLRESLTFHKSAVVAIELAQNTEVALATVLYGMLIQNRTSGQSSWATGGDAGVEVGAKFVSYPEEEFDSLALGTLQENWAVRYEKMPKKPGGELWEYCLKLNHMDKCDLLAILAARAYNAVWPEGDPFGHGSKVRLAQADRVAKSLNVNVSDWYRPTKTEYFSRVSKAVIIENLREAGAALPADINKMKKGELAEYAEKVIGSDWVPELLRIKEPDVKAEAEEFRYRNPMSGEGWRPDSEENKPEDDGLEEEV